VITMDANITEPIRSGKNSLSAFTDELEGELEKISICGVHMTRKVTLSILGIFSIACIIIGVSLGIDFSSGDGIPLREDHRFWSLGEMIESSVGRSIYDNTTYEHEALVWLADSDPKRFDATTPIEKILERFVLANFYFSTGGQGWNRQANFCTKRSVCEWNDKTSGVFCNSDKQVSKILLPQFNLNGTIPHDIGLLSNMEILNLTKNEVSGSIPVSIGIMSSLKSIDLSFNEISGRMPESLAMLMDLTYLDFSFNGLEGSDEISVLKDLPRLEQIHLSHNNLAGNVGQFGVSGSLRVVDISYNSLDGTIPHRFSEGKKLKSLKLNYNFIRGEIPDGMGNLYNLEELDMSTNKLTGSLPSTFGDLVMLQTLKLNSNELQYGLPAELGYLNELSILDVSDNGIDSIPNELFDMANIQRLFLFSNDISGFLPTEIGRATSLVELDLSKNKFSNKIPLELSNLSNLEVLNLNSNRFVGSMPSELSNLFSLREMDLSNNNFFGDMDDAFCNARPDGVNAIERVRADCLTNDISLSCATECCDGKDYCCDVNQTDCKKDRT